MERIVALILTVFLAACTSFSQSSEPAYLHKSTSHYMPWAARKTQLNAVLDWQANGNIAVHSEKGCGANIAFSWQQTEKNYQLRLLGPLGMQSMSLFGNPQHIILRTSGKTTIAQNPEQLVAQQLGFHLPVSQLHHWLRGLPAPQSRYTISLDAYNRLLKLRQSGWHIDYTQYTNSGKIDIPEQIELSNGQWRVKILITHWNLQQSHTDSPR